MQKPLQATTQQAVMVLLGRGLTKYRIAVRLNMAPVSVNQWLRGVRMSKTTATKVMEEFNIEITDSFSR
jgi:DNA-binding NarL/FixJ family response regulator